MGFLHYRFIAKPCALHVGIQDSGPYQAPKSVYVEKGQKADKTLKYWIRPASLTTDAKQDEISELYDVNKFTIAKKFKDRYGTTIIAYYNEKRLAYAKRKLSNPSVTVSQVSSALNFTDVYTFSKFFKMHTGMSPRAYKAQFKGEGND